VPAPLRRGLGAIAALAASSLVLSGCVFLPNIGGGGGGGGSGSPAGFAGDEVSLKPLFVAGDSGGIGTETITISESDDGDTQVDFSEDEVTGFGDQTRAASWNAVTVATLLTGAPLATQYRFAFDGAIDGPSAGALTTVGVLSLYFGDEVDPAATMTGTINPTGTVGVVGGIPEKIQGVIDDGSLERVLIPAGQRNSENAAGELVDVVDLGNDNDVEIIEVATIYDAYRELTGEELPAPEGADSPDVDERGYDKLASGADAALARYDRANAQFFGLDPAITSDPGAAGFADAAAGYAAEARDLQVQGSQAGAFVAAQNSAALMEATYSTYDTVQAILISGFGALDAKLAAASTAEGEFLSFLDQLGTYEPDNLSDAEGLAFAYGQAFDAYSLNTYAAGQLAAVDAGLQAGSYTSLEQLLADLLFPLVYYEFARGQLEYARATFEVGRDNEGGPIADDANLEAVGDFLRRGADANWAAFESGVIQPNAEAEGVSNDVFRNALGNVDLAVALSYSAQQAEPAIAEYIGSSNPNAAYAAMGYGLANYARNATHLEKYYNNGLLDENLTVVGVRSDAILTAALDLGRTQVERAESVLSDQGTNALLSIASYESAGVDREGDVLAKFSAIESYSGAFVLSRALAFLGGYPSTGWQR
jgi:uncharacterized protein